MKSHRGYLPRKDGEKARWTTNLETFVNTRGDELGLTPVESTLLLGASRKIRDSLMRVTKKEKEYNAALSYRDEVCAEEGKIISDIIAAVKRRPGFNKAVGEAAGIIGSTKVQQKDEISPKLIQVFAYSDHVSIGFRKRYTQGISMYSRIAGRNKGKWEHLGYYHKSPFTDRRPTAKPGVPEVREYMARCVKNMEEIGQNSGIVRVTFSGDTLVSKDKPATEE
jgi:hypothetical protein